MKVTVTGATGLIGRALVARLLERGDSVTVLSRSTDKARKALGDDVEAHAWDLMSEPAPSEALLGRDGVVHLAGEPVAQRWTKEHKQAIHDSRETGTRNLVAGLRATDPRPKVLVSASGIGYYGPRGDEQVDEETPAGTDFLAQVTLDWEREAQAADELGVRVVRMRTGIVLSDDGGALASMLPPFKAGVGGPIAGGKQYMPWIHIDDEVGLILAALDNDEWWGPVNGAAPNAVTNKVFSKTLGRVLRRPAFAPVPALAIKALYGEMAEVVTTGQNAIPALAYGHGFEFKYTELEPALRDVLGKPA
jgi:uncharacterized protein (TIGR01777 family)